MQMGNARCEQIRGSGLANRTYDLSTPDLIAYFHQSGIQMNILGPDLIRGPKGVFDLDFFTVFLVETGTKYDTIGDGEDGRSLRRRDIYPLMPSAVEISTGSSTVRV